MCGITGFVNRGERQADRSVLERMNRAILHRGPDDDGFYETEVARRTEQFGCIAHVWSTYESRHDPRDPAPFMRGINSFQLFNDGKRWWILSVYWQHEIAEHAIPQKYL